MKKTKDTLLTVLTVGCIALASCKGNEPISPSSIRINQLGFAPQQEKIAICDGYKACQFTVTNKQTGKLVMSGTSLYTATSPWNKTPRSAIDLSQVRTPGEYLLQTGHDTLSFTIKERPLKPLADAVLKSFYYQRAGMDIESEFAGPWSRKMGHPDDQVIIHPSAASDSRPSGTIISSPKGWYDAGDYNKYIVNSGYSIGQMLAIYRLFPEYFKTQKVHIPESDNNTPDLLDEVYYNLSWMLTMQDPADGGVYHKLTTPCFEGFIEPAACQQPRYVVQKSVTATLGFAASMAQAARIYSDYEQDYPGFAKTALAAAERAYTWAEKHPDAFYNQDDMNKKYAPAVVTGAYGDGNASDEFFWAASELYMLTHKAAYREMAVKQFPKEFKPGSWGDTYQLGFTAWLQPGNQFDSSDSELTQKLLNQLTTYADKSIAEAQQTPFCAPYGNKATDFFWGCLAGQCANQGSALLLAYCLTAKTEYLTNAQRNMDYLLGRNATGYCYVTGFGSKSPLHPHHRLAASDTVSTPLPGFLVGGPNPKQEDKESGVTYTSSLPDESYEDQEPSYASNEIAINWSADMLALATGLDACQSLTTAQ